MSLPRWTQTDIDTRSKTCSYVGNMSGVRRSSKLVIGSRNHHYNFGFLYVCIYIYLITKELSKKTSFLTNCDGSGGRMVCPRRLSFSQFVVLMSMTNCEKDSLLGQTVLPPEPSQFFKKEGIFDNPLFVISILTLSRLG